MMPNADGWRELPRRRNSGSPTSENSSSTHSGEYGHEERAGGRHLAHHYKQLNAQIIPLWEMHRPLLRV
jgi:hypothetical protein